MEEGSLQGLADGKSGRSGELRAAEGELGGPPDDARAGQQAVRTEGGGADGRRAQHAATLQETVCSVRKGNPLVPSRHGEEWAPKAALARSDLTTI